MPKFPRLVTRDGVEAIPIPDEKWPVVIAEFQRRLADGALPAEPVPANDQIPSKLFTGKALAEFCRVWDSLNGKGDQP